MSGRKQHKGYPGGASAHTTTRKGSASIILETSVMSSSLMVAGQGTTPSPRPASASASSADVAIGGAPAKGSTHRTLGGEGSSWRSPYLQVQRPVTTGGLRHSADLNSRESYRRDSSFKHTSSCGDSSSLELIKLEEGIRAMHQLADGGCGTEGADNKPPPQAQPRMPIHGRGASPTGTSASQSHHLEAAIAAARGSKLSMLELFLSKLSHRFLSLLEQHQQQQQYRASSAASSSASSANPSREPPPSAGGAGAGTSMLEAWKQYKSQDEVGRGDVPAILVGACTVLQQVIRTANSSEAALKSSKQEQEELISKLEATTVENSYLKALLAEQAKTIISLNSEKSAEGRPEANPSEELEQVRISLQKEQEERARAEGEVEELERQRAEIQNELESSMKMRLHMEAEVSSKADDLSEWRERALRAEANIPSNVPASSLNSPASSPDIPASSPDTTARLSEHEAMSTTTAGDGAELASTRKRVDDLLSQVNTLLRQLSEQEAKVKDHRLMQATKEDLEEKLAGCKSEILRLEEVQRQLRKTNTEQLKQHQEQLCIHEKRCSLHLTQLRDAEMRCTTAESQVESSKARVDEAKIRYSGAEQRCSELVGQMSQGQRASNAAEARARELDGQLAESEDHARDLESMVDGLQTENATLLDRVSQLEVSVNESSGKWEQSKIDFKKERARLDAEWAEVNAMKGALTNDAQTMKAMGALVKAKTLRFELGGSVMSVMASSESGGVTSTGGGGGSRPVSAEPTAHLRLANLVKELQAQLQRQAQQLEDERRSGLSLGRRLAATEAEAEQERSRWAAAEASAATAAAEMLEALQARNKGGLSEDDEVLVQALREENLALQKMCERFELEAGFNAQAAERLAVELAQQEMQAAAVERECQKLHSQLSISSEKLEGASRTISQQDEMMALLQTRLRMLEEAQEAAMATTAATRATAHSTTTSLDSHLSVAAALATSQAALVTSSRSPIKTESQVSSEATATVFTGSGVGLRRALGSTDNNMAGPRGGGEINSPWIEDAHSLRPGSSAGGGSGSSSWSNSPSARPMSARPMSALSRGVGPPGSLFNSAPRVAIVGPSGGGGGRPTSAHPAGGGVSGGGGGGMGGGRPTSAHPAMRREMDRSLSNGTGGYSQSGDSTTGGGRPSTSHPASRAAGSEPEVGRPRTPGRAYPARPTTAHPSCRSGGAAHASEVAGPRSSGELHPSSAIQQMLRRSSGSNSSFDAAVFSNPGGSPMGGGGGGGGGPIGARISLVNPGLGESSHSESLGSSANTGVMRLAGMMGSGGGSTPTASSRPFSAVPGGGSSSRGASYVRPQSSRTQTTLVLLSTTSPH